MWVDSTAVPPAVLSCGPLKSGFKLHSLVDVDVRARAAPIDTAQPPSTASGRDTAILLCGSAEYYMRMVNNRLKVPTSAPAGVPPRW